MRLVLLEDVIDFAGLYGGEGALVVALKEVERGSRAVGWEGAVGEAAAGEVFLQFDDVCF
jgi:hypothetical protein